LLEGVESQQPVHMLAGCPHDSRRGRRRYIPLEPGTASKRNIFVGNLGGIALRDPLIHSR
jgi:hypothetical protein